MTWAGQTRRKLVGAALAGFVIVLTAVVLVARSRVASGSQPALPVVVKLGPVITEAKSLLHPTQSQGLFLAPDGSLWLWGEPDINWPDARAVPQRLGTSNLWHDVAFSQNNVVGIRSDGTLWGWGESVMLPPDDTPTRPLGRTLHRGSPDAPVRLSAEGGWKSVVSLFGPSFCALKSNGTLWAWGDNRFGQLGEGVGASSVVPRQLGADSDWTQVTAGAIRGYAIKSDRTLWTWGGPEIEPIRQLGFFSDWVNFSADAYCGFGVRSDGSLWGIGPNLAHFCGQPELSRSNLFLCAQVAEGTVPVTGMTVLYLRTKAGELSVSGRLAEGLIGDGVLRGGGTAIRHPGAPLPISTMTNCVDVWSGGYTTTALTGDGTLWLWGRHGGTSRKSQTQQLKGVIGEFLRRRDIRLDSETPTGNWQVVPTPTPLLKLEFSN